MFCMLSLYSILKKLNKRVRKFFCSPYHQYVHNQEQLQAQATYQIQFYNFWSQPNEKMYWHQFIEAKHLLPLDKTVAIFSVFGSRSLIRKVKADVKIFYSAENVHRAVFSQYADHALGEDSIDLAMGFDVLDNPRYIRFPLWPVYMFPADSSEDAIRAKCQQLRFPNLEGKKKFCCMVASNSADGLRGEMFNTLLQIAHVDSAGRYLHNDDSLQNEFADNKQDYLKNYYFNICPENTSSYGYTTEKLFEAISCGCIPVYWGAEFADKAVINEAAVIRWNRDDNGASALRQIRELYVNPESLKEFLSQPRLLPTAEEYILDTFATIESRLRDILQ